MNNKAKKIAYYAGNSALAFSDVYLRPAYSDITSRYGKQITTKTKIANGVPLINIPFVSAGMDTVTEDAMAIIIALNGGIGEIHRNNLPGDQAELVIKVKEKMRVMSQKPPMVSENATIGDALNLLAKRNRGFVIVYKGDKFTGRFSGMATSRDFLAASPETKITRVMTPLNNERGKSLITTHAGISLPKAAQMMEKYRIEKLPVVDKDQKLVGVFTYKHY